MLSVYNSLKTGIPFNVTEELPIVALGAHFNENCKLLPVPKNVSTCLSCVIYCFEVCLSNLIVTLVERITLFPIIAETDP